ncbi:hypothetical protein FQA39_LY17481 [Lamprigera yunnana]|nr:hypothetical protein FQA39_LY17481 [Lamprigera yunnana]
MNNEQCSVCYSYSEYNHKESLLHRFNFALFEWNKYRKALVKNRNGVEIDVKLCDLPKGCKYDYSVKDKIGSHQTMLTEEDAHNLHSGISYLFTITNIQRNNSIFLVKVFLLHPYQIFKLVDFEGELKDDHVLQLLPNASYCFKVTLQVDSLLIGIYSMPIAINLQTSKKDLFTITREMYVSIGNEELLPSNDHKKKSPFTNVVWTDISIQYNPTGKRHKPDSYPIPKRYNNILKMGIDAFIPRSQEETMYLNELSKRIYPEYVTEENYVHFFHIALWIDEIGAELMLQRYNMEDVHMKIVQKKFLELEVPGLAEKRPSLIRGDIINIRLHNDHTVYKGNIFRVNDLNIWISGVRNEFFELIEEYPEHELDVSFEMNRLCYERMHAGIDNCFSKGLLKYLFPHKTLAMEEKIIPMPNYEYFNKSICTNPEQRRAVENIVRQKFRFAPYIIFGPPGTGKTITIVEAIQQIIRRSSSDVILVCAPSNAACDMITSKLIENNLSKSELIRIHSDTRDWSSVPANVKNYSNYANEKYVKLSVELLMTYRVVVTTLIFSGRYIDQKFKPDHVFIDEAAQSLEPEAVIAISLLKPGKQLVLVGDHKQLGPSCSSSVAEKKFKLDISLLERLMQLPLYMNDNPNFITTLKLNFRSHDTVLHIPNSLFYNGELQSVSLKAQSDPITKIFIYNKIFPRIKAKQIGEPVEFCSIFGKEHREGRSPSYFNPKEIEMVLKYVISLKTLCDVAVMESDIGIITPYIRQVYRIKEVLTRNGFPEIEVGTTEAFQGREKRIIIISTVRAQYNLLLHDRKYKLGFLKNNRRLNVALTRAMHKLIVIGCPNVLQYDSNWLRYIEFCESKGAYFGPKRDRRTDNVKKDIMNRLNFVKKSKS